MVTKWSTLPETLNVSEHQAEQISGEPGSVSAGQTIPPPAEAQDAMPAAAKQETASVELIAEQGSAPEPEAPKLDTPKAEAPKAEAPKAEIPKLDVAKVEPPRASSGNVVIMSAGDRASAEEGGAGTQAESTPGSGMFGKRRLAGLAAVVALATVAGALGGALATAGFARFAADEQASISRRALESSLERINAELANLKVGVEHTSKMGMSQFNKTSERLDKFERALAEPTIKLARLSEAVEKLRAAAPVAQPAVAAAPVAPPTVVATPAVAAAPVPAPVAEKEVTASIAAPAPEPAEAPKVETGKLPTVEGWVLRDIDRGAALIQGRRGMYIVYAGDPLPGLGRVDAIRRQDGRWVVVTSKGLIVAR
jgi:outer membrane biosynthesis protein TonB